MCHAVTENWPASVAQRGTTVDITRNGDPAAGEPVPVAEAIAALTAVARTSGDFGEIACQALTSVAANIGGVEQLLARSPDSRGSAHVRDIITSTAGQEGPDLARWRTEPVRLSLDVEDMFLQLGLTLLYADAIDVVDGKEDDADHYLFEAVATADEWERSEKIAATYLEFGSTEADDERLRLLADEVGRIGIQVHERARAAGHPLLSAFDEALGFRKSVVELWERDKTAYAEAYAATVRRLLAERSIEVDVELSIGQREQVLNGHPGDELAEELNELARQHTPLPMTGTAPDWTPGATLADLRASNQTYLDRAQRCRSTVTPGPVGT